MCLNEEKNALRKAFSDKRKAVQNKKQADETIFQRLIQSEEFQNCDTVLIYVSVRSEVDTIGIIEACFSLNKKTAVPICRDNGIMTFHRISSFSDLCNSKFGIPQPDESAEIAATEKTLCVVPGLSFDKSGYRLGYGGGYYDRFLASFKGETIGLCYDDCISECLPHGDYDKKVSKVITEKTILF